MRKMILGKLVLVVLGIFSVSASAYEWVYVGDASQIKWQMSPDGTVWFLQTELFRSVSWQPATVA